jgi:hypothetical protein
VTSLFALELTNLLVGLLSTRKQNGYLSCGQALQQNAFTYLLPWVGVLPGNHTENAPLKLHKKFQPHF